ncbi:hypothetical protein ZWY2020_043682 [Hordeum vulgare]|uniref:GRF-type domain-containing protein n=1 Tax=Hordeum vulgare subsp. vulgare TaxID=112509 RepID=A0A8I6WVJ9_HORVV|nr:hypothetical protein ZWY2020_043682 [Hordeum vulgare]
MASSGSMTRPPCADQEDMSNIWREAELDKIKEKDVPTPPCWCGDVCKVKVSTDRKNSWIEGRRFFVCPNYAHDHARPTNAYEVPLLPPPLCKYFTWIDHEVREHIHEDQYRDCMWRQHIFNESLARAEERERREEKEHNKRDDERKCKEKEARQEERARKLARAHAAQAEDEAHDKKGKWPRTTK